MSAIVEHGLQKSASLQVNLKLYHLLMRTSISSSEIACNRLALSPEVRKRHFETLRLAFCARHKSVRELSNGFEFEFPSDQVTVQLIAEWAENERLCCPFLSIDLRLDEKNNGFCLRLTGSEAVKQFIESDVASWLKSAG